MVLADTERVEPGLVGENGLVDDVAKRFGVGERAAGGVKIDVAEGVETEFDGGHGVLVDYCAFSDVNTAR